MLQERHIFVTVIGTEWEYLENIICNRFQHMLKIIIYTGIFIYSTLFLLDGVCKDYLNIREIFEM